MSDELIEKVVAAVRSAMFGTDYESAFWENEIVAAARAALAAIESSETHVVVPVRLTEEMARAVVDATTDEEQEIWRTLIAARPKVLP